MSSLRCVERRRDREGGRGREEEGRKELVNRQLKTLIEMFYVIQRQFSVSIKKELDEQ